MKQKLSILLAVVLPLSLFAGCTPADVPSTGDPSADASVTDSNVSDTSSSETDAITSETNTDASTDSESSQTSSDTAVIKTVLTLEDIKTLTDVLIPKETPVSYLSDFFGCPGVRAPTGRNWLGWELEGCNFYYLPYERTKVFHYFIEPHEGNFVLGAEVNEILKTLGLNPEQYERGQEYESMNDHNKSVYKVSRCGYPIPGTEKVVVVVYKCYLVANKNEVPEDMIGVPYLIGLYVQSVHENW